ncbi:MAG: GHMP kinase [Acidobacteria bacterium]|nr:MAG: GHMP kinase [Acidobacteriota bacterium]
MFTIVENNSFALRDVDWFVEQLNALSSFDPGRDVIVTRAPGRLDVIGGIADYSGSLVLEMPIAEATFAAIQRNSSGTIEITTIEEQISTFEMPLEDLRFDDEPLDLASAKNYFAKRNDGDWVRYVAGVFFVLGKQLGVRFTEGAKIVVASRVPIGKGVSSSAALEVSVMQAVCFAHEIDIAPRDLALLCQTVENHIVGAACGVMDQISTHRGEPGKLTAIVCQPAEIRGSIDIPDGIEFWGIDSGVRHAVSGSDYSSVRIGAFMGYRIIAELAGLDARQVGEGNVEIDDERWNGYLANVSPEEYEKEFRDKLPDSMDGQEFLSLYLGTTDTVTSVDADKTYAIKTPTEHAIYENWRVHRFAELMMNQFDKAGELMFASHESYKACGLTESRTDRIVDLVKSRRDKGLFGARITGGGSGGTVGVLARRGSRDAIEELAAQLEKETGEKPYIFHGSSPGCSLFGSVRLRSQKEGIRNA